MLIFLPTIRHLSSASCLNSFLKTGKFPYFDAPVSREARPKKLSHVSLKRQYECLNISSGRLFWSSVSRSFRDVALNAPYISRLLAPRRRKNQPTDRQPCKLFSAPKGLPSIEPPGFSPGKRRDLWGTEHINEAFLPPPVFNKRSYQNFGPFTPWESSPLSGRLVSFDRKYRKQCV